ncbi:MAG: C10 family peptidase [Muribaculaceae bacterium]|nr:C10 family peptidase [Muribaculaceae bacterium]
MRRILLCAAVLFAAIGLSAAPVSMRTAQAKAQSFVQQKAYAGKLRAPISGEVKLAHTEMNSKMMDRAVYYIFNSHNGYVIVSGDDRAEEILGYGDAPLDINAIPCNMKAWLATYKEQIEYLQAHEGLQVETPSMMAPSLRTASVAPLLTALWDQESPYWNQCKINGYQCLTGCPATSAAMIFHYWKYPDFETPEVPAYRCHLSTGYYSSQYVNVDALPPVTFDWDNMLDEYSGNYTTEQANAVATLMRYIGQVERMEYGTSSAGGSGVDADSVSLMAGAFTFFGYDEETVRVVKKTSSYSGGTTLYSDAEWAAMIQEELAEGRPILFCAIAGGFFGGGHAFNVDGYDSTTNKYHINFGWSGDYNNYYALNAFNGGGSTFNQYQQMVIGIQPPIKSPRLKADKSELSMECFKNNTATSKFALTGRNLEGNVTLKLDDENGVFSIDNTALTPNEEGRVSQDINVTYAPKTEGEYTATITVSTQGVEEFVITLHGSSDYELYRPVMQPADANNITATSFRADWTDNTPAENVVSYTLEVKTKPDVTLLTEGDWSDVPQENTNHASDAANYLPEGWTFIGNNFYLDGGFISAGRNSVIKVNCDMAGYSKVSVIIKAKAYTKGAATTLDVSTDVESQRLTLAKEVETYLVVLEVGDHGFVQFTTGYYPEIQSIKIYGGEITDPEPFQFKAAQETGDAEFRLIEGITPDKFYTVTGLLPGTSYLYRVKSNYVNGTESKWSNIKEVILKAGESMRGDVNMDGVVSIDDVASLIDYLLNGTGGDAVAADCDMNGEVSIDDLACLIDYLLSEAW